MDLEGRVGDGGVENWTREASAEAAKEERNLYAEAEEEAEAEASAAGWLAMEVSVA